MIQLPTKEPPGWTSANAQALRKFLESPDGQAALFHWLEAKPPLLDGTDVNKTLVASGKVAGFDLAVDRLVNLTVETPEEKPRSVAYPPLDDESAWPKPTQ